MAQPTPKVSPVMIARAQAAKRINPKKTIGDVIVEHNNLIGNASKKRGQASSIENSGIIGKVIGMFSDNPSKLRSEADSMDKVAYKLKGGLQKQLGTKTSDIGGYIQQTPTMLRAIANKKKK
jgi:hypothetical protein